MKHRLLYSAAALLLASLSARAHADAYQFGFGGSGVSGYITLTYGSTTDSKVPQGFEVTGASGTFSDATLGILNAPILGLIPINHATPEPTNLRAPNDFSRFAVASGTMDGSLNYDNLFYPGGSPQTATDYPFHGGFLDIYGLLFDVGNGTVLNFWSNGVTPGATMPDYGFALATSATTLDYVGGVAVTPEPGSLYLLGTGTIALLVRRRHLFRA